MLRVLYMALLRSRNPQSEHENTNTHTNTNKQALPKANVSIDTWEDV